MTEPDHTEIIELLASTDSDTAVAVAAIQRLGLRSLLPDSNSRSTTSPSRPS